jgi:hypothetical protein
MLWQVAICPALQKAGFVTPIQGRGLTSMVGEMQRGQGLERLRTFTYSVHWLLCEDCKVSGRPILLLLLVYLKRARF